MPQAFAQGINNNQDLAVRVEDSSGVLQNAAIRERGTWMRVSFPIIGGINIHGNGVRTSDTAQRNGLLLKGGTQTAITFPGAVFTDPVGLNDKDVIVGNYSVNGTDFPVHGFIATPK